METAEKQKQLSLLLVDDDEELCGMMDEYFAEAGHHLDCAHNGRDGLACALNGAYDLVILDVMLPIIDGLALLEQLRRRKDLPVIMLDVYKRQLPNPGNRGNLPINKPGTRIAAANPQALVESLGNLSLVEDETLKHQSI